MDNMLTFFDWDLLKTLSFKELKTYFLAVNGKDTLNTAKLIKAFSSTKKDSWVKDAISLFDNKMRATESEILIYLDLLSKRNYLDYKMYNITTLPTYLATTYNIEKLKLNRLLRIKDNLIYFIYEDNYGNFI